MKNRILITGGAGFIGINSARHFLNKGWEVDILDNFSRKGADLNVKWLLDEYPSGNIKIIKADIVKDYLALCEAISKVDVVLHLAAQTAVTTSIIDPRRDFETNAIGYFNVLEAVRNSKNRPIALYASTNKVYGCLGHYSVREMDKHYRFHHDEIHEYGIHEKENLDFHSPYGCSKGIADQYFIDYGRIYGLKTVVFRQSCIYGPYQFGIEDQGWVAWFAIATLLDKGLTIYGTGKQVRDILHVKDLVELYELAINNIETVSGKAYNVGGGPQNNMSLLNLIDMLESRSNKKINLKYAQPRAGDQPIFISDIRRAGKEMNWKPKHDISAGFENMMVWIEKNQSVFKKFFE